MIVSIFNVPVAAVADIFIFSLGETNKTESARSNWSVSAFQSIPSPASAEYPSAIPSIASVTYVCVAKLAVFTIPWTFSVSPACVESALAKLLRCPATDFVFMLVAVPFKSLVVGIVVDP